MKHLLAILILFSSCVTATPADSKLELRVEKLESQMAKLRHDFGEALMEIELLKTTPNDKHLENGFMR